MWYIFTGEIGSVVFADENMMYEIKLSGNVSQNQVGSVHTRYLPYIMHSSYTLPTIYNAQFIHITYHI